MVSLALGIGATAAVFSLIQGVLLTPPPYGDPGWLVLIPAERSDGRPSGDKEWAAAHLDRMGEGCGVSRLDRGVRLDVQLHGAERRE